MPHTNKRKKPQYNRRREITDDEGWTRVISGPAPDRPRSIGYAFDRKLELRKSDSHLDSSPQSVILRQQPVQNMTLDKLQRSYKVIEDRWEKSESCKALKGVLQDRVLKGLPKITNCLCFGTGTPSGLTAGWIQRHEVALYQIAAFKSVIDSIERAQGHRPLAFAQEPCYNRLDEELLGSLTIATIDHPKGFDLLSTSSFAFCPGAELHVNLWTLERDPVVYLGSSLDLYCGREGREHSAVFKNRGQAGGEYYNAEDMHAKKYDDGPGKGQDSILQSHSLIDAYTLGKEVARFPDLEAKDHPFHQQHLYWRSPTD